MATTCTVCGVDLGWDRPSGVCSETCLRRGQGFVNERACCMCGDPVVRDMVVSPGVLCVECQCILDRATRAWIMEDDEPVYPACVDDVREQCLSEALLRDAAAPADGPVVRAQGRRQWPGG